MFPPSGLWPTLLRDFFFTVTYSFVVKFEGKRQKSGGSVRVEVWPRSGVALLQLGVCSLKEFDLS